MFRVLRIFSKPLDTLEYLFLCKKKPRHYPITLARYVYAEIDADVLSVLSTSKEITFGFERQRNL